jgi:class 3 adenylate cyclase/tetratricopeptide (TPR) repeat protein
MICGNCGAENRPGRKFCMRCGQPLSVVCSNCGAANEPEAGFCGECGTALGASRAPTPPASPPSGTAPVAERRLVSILFADLVGFTTFAEGRDAEDVRDTLSRYFDLAQDVCVRYGGTIEKFIGDAVMAVWGAPTAHEDDAERAVRAGLELVDAVGKLGPRIEARAGVLTGEAAVTLGATNQGMVAGDLVNTASRLQSVALPGTVLVGEATQRAASRAIAFEEAGEQTVKGKTLPVAAWRALRVVAERGGRNRSETLEAPFVGRDDELRLLKELFHATAREKRARLASVLGAAGIGKSRLAWEFLKYTDGLVERVWWHDGRSPAYGDGISFWALGEMIRGRCGLRETDDEPTTRARVAEALATHVPDPEERRWIEPALLALLGFESKIGSEQLFGAWRTFFERLAATAPVVLVFEDFHFADSGLIDFVDHLLEWGRNAPIYVVTLARPELLEKRRDWGAGKRNFTSLYLEPLPEPAMRRLLVGLVPGLPEPAIRSIVGRADGIPLYAVETVRMLVAQGRLAFEDGAYRPVGDLTTLAVPETLTALIASRLDGLAPEERASVSDAAVLGQTFSLAALAAVSGAPEAEIEPRLRTLVRRELLTVDADPRSPERGQYAFVQALIREVAYNTLARADRKVRHLAAARYFEGLGTDELAGALAGHYLAAHANAPEGSEADALAGQARIALKAAADRAATLGAHEQAVSFLDQALTVTTDPSDRASLMEQAGASAAAAAHHEAAERLLRDALGAQRARGDRQAIARATAALGRALIYASRPADAVAILGPAAAEFSDLANDPSVMDLGGQLARALMLIDDFGGAIEACDRVLQTAEPATLDSIVADVLVTKGTALAALGRTIEGFGALGAGQELAQALGLGAIELRAFMNRSAFEGGRDPGLALEAARQGLALAGRLGQRSFSVGLLSNAAEDAFRTGDWEWALSELEPALADELEGPDRGRLLQVSLYMRASRGESVASVVDELSRLLGSSTNMIWRSMMDMATAYAAFAGGDLAAARGTWRKVASTSAEYLPMSLASAARAALWAGDVAGAREDLAALGASAIHGPAIDAARTTIQAGIAAMEGRQSDALGLYRQALRTWRDLELAWDEALCGIDMATLIDPREPEVVAVAGSTREILVRLGAVPFVDRLDAAVARDGAGPRRRDIAPPDEIEIRAIDGDR